MQPGAELSIGLEVINSTNLHYFNGPQKAEFFCLKGIFLQRLALVQDEQRLVLMDRAKDCETTPGSDAFTCPRRDDAADILGMCLGAWRRTPTAFSTALHVSDQSAKAWAAVGALHEQQFKERSRDVVEAANAVTSYLSAAKHARPDRARRVRGRGASSNRARRRVSPSTDGRLTFGLNLCLFGAQGAGRGGGGAGGRGMARARCSCWRVRCG